LKRQNVVYVIPLVGLLIGLWNVFTDGEGETEGGRERNGLEAKRKQYFNEQHEKNGG
jgi:hypothetical protein